MPARMPKRLQATLPPLTDRAAVINHLKKMYELFSVDNGIFVLDAKESFMPIILLIRIFTGTRLPFATIISVP